MTETQQAAAAQAANGQAPGAPGPAAELDTGERWLGILVITAGVFLLLIGIDRVTGGALSGRLFSEEGPDASG